MGATVQIGPGTSHFLILEKADLVNKIVIDFLTLDPVPTVAGIRRAKQPGAAAGTEHHE